MAGGKHLLLLAVFVILARCQQKPEVSMSPELGEIFSGDLFYLNCKNTSGAEVKWYFNDEEKPQTDKTWKIAVASPKHSGSYHCVSSGQQSEKLSIKVQECIPRASLIIQTGQPVMRPGGSVILQLDNDAGLEGWNCWVYRTTKGTTRRIKLKLNSDSVSLPFQRSLDDLETIFWCTDRTKQSRSNQITVRLSDKEVSLEMYPLPVVTGESLTLRCLTWGTDQISQAVFYKDNNILQDSSSPTITFPNVEESVKGRYKCDATFTYTARTDGPPYHMTSDDQDLYVQVSAAPMKAILDGNNGMSCSCPLCPSGVSYRWYMNNDEGQPAQLPDQSQGSMTPDQSGTYACRAVWKTGRSYLSNSYAYKPPINIIPVIVVIMLVLLGLAVVGGAFYMYYRRRDTTGPIYEDVAQRSRDKGDDKYEMLQRPHGAQKEAEYDTLHPEASGGAKKEGEYEPLKKEEMKEGVYHTLGTEGAAGGEGGYEALKKEGMKEGVYHTLGTEGAAGGDGGYEALKKEGMKEGVYHTLGTEGAAGGDGGYEALKKEGMKEGVYHTLGTEGGKEVSEGRGAQE